MGIVDNSSNERQSLYPVSSTDNALHVFSYNSRAKHCAEKNESQYLIFRLQKMCFDLNDFGSDFSHSAFNHLNHTAFS